MITKKQIHFALDLCFNLAFPWVAYKIALPIWGEFGALLSSAVPPLIWSLVELARHRRLDALSILILSGIGLSLVALLLGGDQRILLVRESLVSGLIGVAFLASAILSKPLIYHLARATARRQGDEDGSGFDDWWGHPDSQKMLRILSIGWGFGLTLEALLRGWLAWHWEAERFLMFSPIVSYGVIGLILLWTVWYRRKVASAQAAEDDQTP